MADKGRVVTIKEASRITGLSVSALRMHLKKGLIEGVKKNSKFGDTWLIKADSIKGKWKVDSDGLNVATPSQLTPSKLSTSPPHMSDKNEAAAMSEHLKDLQRVIGNYENILSTFQARITNLEYEKKVFEEKLKMLPAPVETVTMKLEVLERRLQEKEAALGEQAARLQEEWKARARIEAELQQERSLPWWKKMFRR